MSEIRGKVREQIAEQFYGGYCEMEDRNGHEWQAAVNNANQVLSIPELAIVDRGAELPKFILPTHIGEQTAVGMVAREWHEHTQREMLKDGYVKEIK